jgi:hypothetical protein
MFANTEQLIIHLGLGHGLLHQLLPHQAKVAPLLLTPSEPATAQKTPHVIVDKDMACFMCDFKAQRYLGRESRRYVMYGHYVVHYHAQLQAYIRDQATCSLCGKQCKNRLIVERHLALRHNLMESLLPEDKRIPASSGDQVSSEDSFSDSSSSCSADIVWPSAGVDVIFPSSGGSSQSSATIQSADLTGLLDRNSSLLTCPLCKVTLFTHPIRPGRRRDYLYQHLISHYKPELLAHADGNVCRFCGKEQKPRNLLRHVGTVHGVLDSLLPPPLVAVLHRIAKVGRPNKKAGKRSGTGRVSTDSGGSIGIDTAPEEESEDGNLMTEDEIKMESEDHFQVPVRVPVFFF